MKPPRAFRASLPDDLARQDLGTYQVEDGEAEGRAAETHFNLICEARL